MVVKMQSAMNLTERQGHVVRENKPVRLQYYQTWLKSDGPPTDVIVKIRYFADPEDKGAPLYKDNRQ